MFNGPLRLSAHTRVFAGGPKAPAWLYRGVSWASRLAGLAMLVALAWHSTGALRDTLLLGLVLAIGLFCLLDGPTRVITGLGVLRSGVESPAWLVGVAIWFIRMVGVVALLGVLVVSITAATG